MAFRTASRGSAAAAPAAPAESPLSLFLFLFRPPPTLITLAGTASSAGSGVCRYPATTSMASKEERLSHAHLVGAEPLGRSDDIRAACHPASSLDLGGGRLIAMADAVMGAHRRGGERQHGGGRGNLRQQRS